MVNALGRVRLLGVLVSGSVRVGVILLVQIGQSVVDFTVLGLVSAHIEDQVPNGALALGHPPVLDGDLRCRGVVPFGDSVLLDILNGARVSYNSLLLEVSDEAVADARRNHVRKEETVVEDTLGTHDHEAHEDSGSGHLEETHQVHTFVECLFQESLDPVRPSQLVNSLHQVER